MDKKLVVYMDDLNMPKVDNYGTMQPIALLKLLIERGGFFDRAKGLHWKNMKDVQFVGSMNPPGGARNHVDQRFISLFNVVEVQPPTRENLRSIFTTLLRHCTLSLPEETSSAIEQLTPMTLQLYEHTLESLLPTPQRFHYIFNLRDLSQVFEGVSFATPEKVPDGASVMRLWRNECMRVFHDRLISDSDRGFITGTIESLLHKHAPSADDATFALADPLLYGDLLSASEETNNPRVYEDMGSYSDVKQAVERCV